MIGLVAAWRLLGVRVLMQNTAGMSAMGRVIAIAGEEYIVKFDGWVCTNSYSVKQIMKAQALQ